MGIYLDVVDRDILLDKLYVYGIRGHVHEWFKRYLKGRQQFVKINDNASKCKFINMGMPQGSVLGPLLFIIYISMISQII